VAEVFVTLSMDRVQNERQAQLICELLGCDGLIVPTVTAYDPYDPPKLGASLQLFVRQTPEQAQSKQEATRAAATINPHDLVRQPKAMDVPAGSASMRPPRQADAAADVPPPPAPVLPPGAVLLPALPMDGGFVQVVGVYDAANGSVRSALEQYAQGRNDPSGPLGAQEYLMSMDRYCGFVYFTMIADLMNNPRLRHAYGAGPVAREGASSKKANAHSGGIGGVAHAVNDFLAGG
jgi:hypothetical protein